MPLKKSSIIPFRPQQQTLLLAEQAFDGHLRAINFQMLMLATASVLLVLVYQDLCFNRDNLVFSEDFHICPEAFVFKCIAWFWYALLVWRLIVYYRIRASQKVYFSGYSSRSEAFWKSGLWKPFLMELIVNTVMPLPVPLDWAFQNNIVILLFVFKLYLFIRLLRDHSPVYQQRSQIKEEPSFKEFQAYDYSVSYGTVLKTYFFTYTILFVSVMFLFIMFFMSYMMFLSEREYWVNFNVRPFGLWKVKEHNGELPDSDYIRTWFWQYDNCMWFCIVTFTTLGYGDMYPMYWQGRLFAICIVLTGLVVASLIVGVITNKLVPTEFENLVMGWLTKERMREEEKNFAATVIQVAWREYSNVKNIGDFKKREQLIGKRIKSSIRPWVKRFRTVKRNLIATEKVDDTRTADTNQLLLKEMDELHTQLEELFKQICDPPVQSK